MQIKCTLTQSQLALQPHAVIGTTRSLHCVAMDGSGGYFLLQSSNLCPYDVPICDTTAVSEQDMLSDMLQDMLPAKTMANITSIY